MPDAPQQRLYVIANFGKESVRRFTSFLVRRKVLGTLTPQPIDL